MKLRYASCSFLLMVGLVTTTGGQPERGAGKSPTRDRDEVVLEAAILHFLASTSDDARFIGNTDGTGALLHVRNPDKVGWL